MKSLILLSLALVSSVAFAQGAADRIPVLNGSILEFDEVRLVERIQPACPTCAGGTPVVSIVATATFSNSCMAPNAIVREKAPRSSERSASYRVIRADEEGRACPAVYKPVRRSFVIDSFSAGNGVPAIRVNGKQIN